MGVCVPKKDDMLLEELHTVGRLPGCPGLSQQPRLRPKCLDEARSTLSYMKRVDTMAASVRRETNTVMLLVMTCEHLRRQSTNLMPFPHTLLSLALLRLPLASLFRMARASFPTLHTHSTLPSRSSLLPLTLAPFLCPLFSLSPDDGYTIVVVTTTWPPSHDHDDSCYCSNDEHLTTLAMAMAR
jgi:hypothetical protein